MAIEPDGGAHRLPGEGGGVAEAIPSRTLLGRLRARPVQAFPRLLGKSAAGVDEGALSRPSLHRDTTYRRALAIADVLAVALATLVAVALLGDDGLALGALLAVPVFVLAGKSVGLYDRDQHLVRKTTLDEAPALFQAATLATLVAWLAEGVLIQGTFGRGQLLALWILLFVGMLCGRTLARRAARALAAEERCLIVADGAAAAWAGAKVDASMAVKAVHVGSIPLRGEHFAGGGVPVLGTLDRLGEVIVEHRVDRVIIAVEGHESSGTLDVIRLVKALGVKVSVLPRLFEVIGSSVEFDDVDGMTLLGVRRYGLTKSSSALKRTMDLTVSLILLAVLAPLLAMISVAVGLTSRGPILFRQARIGRNDREFEMLKFRTMVDGAEDGRAALSERNEAGGGLFKIAEDPRVTAVGRFLRRTSLDELPQLMNVLRGEMSLVGPRPLIAVEDSRVEGWQRRRLLLSPGMTGVWQVLGSARVPLDEMVKLDYLYGANWSVWTDVKILCRTLPYVLGRRGM